MTDTNKTLTEEQKQHIKTIASESSNPCLKLIAHAVWEGDSQEWYEEFIDGPMDEANEVNAHGWECFYRWDCETGLPHQGSHKYESRHVAKKIFTDEWIGWTEWYASEYGRYGLDEMPNSPEVLTMKIEMMPVVVFSREVQKTETQMPESQKSPVN